MCLSPQSDRLRAGQNKQQAPLLRNKTAVVIQDEFAREMNRLVHEESKLCCEACQTFDLGQRQHNCIAMEEEEVWANYFEKAKKRIDVERFWKRIRRAVLMKLGLCLVESWMNYVYSLLLMDETNAFLLYKSYERKQINN